MDDARIAVDQPRRQMARSTAFALVTFAFTATMLGTTLPTPLYPIYQDTFNLSKVMLTVIYATYAVGVITALVLLGQLSDQIGRRRMLLLSLRLSAVSAVAFLLADGIDAGVGVLLVGRALSGLSAGIMTGTATAALVDLAPARRPARASLVAAAANLGGLGLGPLLAGVLAAYAPQPTRLCFLIDLALIAAALIGIELLPEPRRVEGRVRLRVQRLRIPPEVRPTFLRAAAPGFAGFAVLGLFTAVAAALLGIVLHRTDHFLTGVLACSGFAASLVGQVISMRMSERRALLSGCGVLVIAMGLVGTSLTAASLPLLLAAAVAAGIGQGLSFRAGLAMVTGASPTGQRAAVASSYFTTAYVALSIPVIGVGAGAQAFGWVSAATAFCALVALLPLVVMLGLLRPERPRPVRELTAGAPVSPALPAAPPLPVPREHPPLRPPRLALPMAADGARNGSPLPVLPRRALAPPVVPGLSGPVVPAPRPAIHAPPAALRALPPPPASATPAAPATPPTPAIPPAPGSRRPAIEAVPSHLAALVGLPSPADLPEPAPLPPRVYPLPTSRAPAPQPPLPAPWHAPPSAPHEPPPPRMPHPWRRPPHRSTDTPPATAEAS
jgi:MFS family permease